MGDTRTDLVDEMRNRPWTPQRSALVAAAKAGHFHCFKSPLAMPKVALVEALHASGNYDLAERAIAGEWDESPDAEDDAEMRAEIGSEMFERAMRAETPEEVIAIANGANRADRRAARKRAGN